MEVEEQPLQGNGQRVFVEMVGSTMQAVLHIQKVGLANLLLIGQ